VKLRAARKPDALVDQVRMHVPQGGHHTELIPEAAMREHIGDDPLSVDGIMKAKGNGSVLKTYGQFVLTLQSPHAFVQFQEQLVTLGAVLQHSQGKCQGVDHNQFNLKGQLGFLVEVL